jgi:hypothetical protein
MIGRCFRIGVFILCVAVFIAGGCGGSDSKSAFDPLALAPVASNHGVPEAAPYDPNQPGPHNAVLLASSGTTHVWSELLPDDWAATSLSDTELVVLVSPSREVVIQSCAYNIGPNIERYRFEVDVVLCEARTGAAVASSTLQGSIPESCPMTAPMSQTRTQGSFVQYTQLEAWLQTFVQ